MTRTQALQRYLDNLRNGRSADHAYALQQFGDDCERIGREGRVAEGEVALKRVLRDIAGTIQVPQVYPR